MHHKPCFNQIEVQLEFWKLITKKVCMARGSLGGSYEWGVTALVHMYDNLNYACKSGDKQLVGYITLLQVIVNDSYLIDFNMFIWNFFCSDQICVVLNLWGFFIYCWGFYGLRLWWKVTTCLSLDIYEGITSIDVSKASRSTNGCWCLLDALWWSPCSLRVWPHFMFSGYIWWSSIVVIHRPKRVVRQFGHVQTISPHFPGSRLSFKYIDDKWMHFSEYLAPVG